MYIETIEGKETVLTIRALSEKDFDLTEIINGVEVMAASPLGKHQRTVRNLYDILRQYTKKHKRGELFFAPLDVILKENFQRLQPDIVFIKNENMGIFQDFIRGVPDMVCEVVSIGSLYKDTTTKKDIYEAYQVPEYWIVIPELKTIEVLTIEAGGYKLFSVVGAEGVICSKVIEGLQIDVRDVFDD
ncbi:MAG: Uma2 family endonuclease [Candidatus Magnetoovum sp. WYHC-5]|nr:Uma2 family endonuclease [Candidatus Magnetoovum sp. WYHC-5]